MTTTDTHSLAERLRDVRARTIADRKLLDAAADELDRLRSMTTDHNALVAIIGDALRDGLDSGRVHIGPRAEHAVIERSVEHLECAGYTLTIVAERER